jgi:hypothetical protein
MSVEARRRHSHVVERPEDGWISMADLANPAGQAQRHSLIAAAAGPGAPDRLPVVWELEAVAWFVGAAVGGAE